MNKVIFHQHLEKSSSTQTSNHCVEWMSILLEVSHRHSLHKGLNEYRISGHFFESLRKVDLLVANEVLIKDVEVILFNVEVDLIDQSLLE